MTVPPGAGPIGRLLASGANLLATVLALVRTRLELLSVEAQLELHRAAVMLGWLLLAIQAAMIGLIVAALWIVIYFWDTHRLLATGLVAFAFLALAGAAAWRLAQLWRTRPQPFAGTLAELARDSERWRDRG